MLFGCVEALPNRQENGLSWRASAAFGRPDRLEVAIDGSRLDRSDDRLVVAVDDLIGLLGVHGRTPTHRLVASRLAASRLVNRYPLSATYQPWKFSQWSRIFPFRSFFVV